MIDPRINPEKKINISKDVETVLLRSFLFSRTLIGHSRIYETPSASRIGVRTSVKK
jgi:hypothetical protein